MTGPAMLYRAEANYTLLPLRGADRFGVAASAKTIYTRCTCRVKGQRCPFA